MWLRRNGSKDACFFWRQAKSFYKATTTLPNTSAPLTAYYSFLNAAKCLLTVRGCVYSDKHGVSGRTVPGRTSLANELVTFQGGGVHAALRQFLGDGTAKCQYSLKVLLYNLPFVHRAYTLTFRVPELFIPISQPAFVRKRRSTEAWIQFEIPGRYGTQKTFAAFPKGWEHDPTDTNAFTVRKRDRFQWSRKLSKSDNMERLVAFHREVRRDLQFISGASRLWYIKRRPAKVTAALVDQSSLAITFAVMHKLSELARYTPRRLDKHFIAKHNWLLSEFLSLAPSQFIDEIASEITGYEFLPVGIDSRPR